MSIHTVLGSISGGKVLDIATGRGGFVSRLAEELVDYEEITGIDNKATCEEGFRQTFDDNPKIHFRLMDAHKLEYGDGSFDTVSVSNSLHHFSDPAAVLQEMLRVLSPGGRIIMAEMYRDGQTETQMTHMLLHHWWAKIDQLLGIVHHPTFTRGELISLVEAAEVVDLELTDFAELDEDPLAGELLAELDEIIDTYLARAKRHPELQREGETLRTRVHTVGYHNATQLVVVGKKP